MPLSAKLSFVWSPFPIANFADFAPGSPPALPPSLSPAFRIVESTRQLGTTSHPTLENRSTFKPGAEATPSSPSRPAASSPTHPLRWSGRGWFLGLLLVLAVFLAYIPVWRAGFVWDDRSMLTANPCIVGPLGLRQLWTTHFADICPLTLSAFWLEHALWGLSPAPYHLVNVLLHTADALLLWRVLRALRIPGAWLGAALWALHPVEVESVAWVTEQKNTLSGVFFLAAALCFLRWLSTRQPPLSAPIASHPRRWPWYALAVFCAALAMAAKSSTVVLPVVLGLCVWWREGRVRRWHVVSLTPLLVLSLAAGAVSLWTQSVTLALSGEPHFASAWPTRLVTAADAVWFYLGKLLWPHPLVAIYPRWPVHAEHWLDWLPVLALVGLLLLVWPRRGSPWGRAVLFALAYFLSAVLPALGLLDNTIFRYGQVFDHFQYLASMGPLALAGAGLGRLSRFVPPGKAWWAGGPTACLLLTLGTVSWQHATIYRDEETFWTDTVTRNPQSWLAHGNLGSALLLRGREADARSHYETALALNSSYAEAHNNLGVIFLRRGEIDAALVQDRSAVSLAPNDAEAHSNLGNALAAHGEVDSAILQYQSALALNPDFPAVYFNLANALFAKGQVDAAISRYEKALALNPAYAEAYSNLGNAFLAKRQLGDAITRYEQALALNPGYAEAHNNLGVALLRTARFDEAVEQFKAALRLAPDYPNVRGNLATAQMLARRAHPGR